MINLYDLLCSLQSIIKLKERERVRQREIGGDRDIADSGLKHNRQGPSYAQLNEQAYIASNEKCETVSH